MNKSVYIAKHGALLAFLAVNLTNTILYFAGAGNLNILPLLAVAVFAGFFGCIFGLVRTEDSTVLFN